MAGHPSTIGAYEIRGILGSGGMGVVYRATRGDGPEVALKTLRTSSPQESASLRREIAALARLAHPEIVRILDHGYDARLQRPWYTMELIDGVPLDRFGADAGDDDAFVGPAPTADGRAPRPATDAADTRVDAPATLLATPLPAGGKVTGLAPDPGTDAFAETQAIEVLDEAETTGIFESQEEPEAQPALPAGTIDDPSIRRALDLVARLCESLAWLHGEGVVHCDLKPANVLVDRAGVPRLMDFGLARSIGSNRQRDTLEEVAAGAGTLAFMAPEQLDGREVDARADIYAVGCMLYVMLTGDPPYLASSPMALVRAHLHEPPPALSTRNPSLPPALDALAARLLAKAPGARIGFAEDVAGALRQLTGTPRPSDTPAPRTYVYRPRLVGRDEVLEQIEAALPTAPTPGSADLLLLSGPPGVGKTRLAREVMRLAAGPGHRGLVLVGRPSTVADPGSPGLLAAPLGALGEALTKLAELSRATSEDEFDYVFGSGALEQLVAYHPTLRPEAEAKPVPASKASDGREAVLSAVTGVLRRAAESKPILLVIDDVQWVDPLVVDWLIRVSRGDLAGARCKVFCTVRAAAAELLEARCAGTGLARLTIDRFDRATTAAIVADALALKTLDERFVELAYALSGGNAASLMESMLAGVEAGILVRRQGRWRVARAATDAGNVERGARLVRFRLRQSDAEVRMAAEGAAVVSGEVRVDALAGLLGWTEDALAAPLARLEAMAFVALGDDRASLTYTHEAMRSAVLTTIDAARLRALHTAAAETFERQRASDPSATTAAALAHHWAKAGRPQRAAAYHREAALAAVERFAWEAVGGHVEAWRRLSPGPSETHVEMLCLQVSEAFLPAADFDGARACVAEAFAMADALDSPVALARARFARSITNRLNGNHAASVTDMEPAIEAFRAAGLMEDAHLGQGLLANDYFFTQRFAEAEAIARQAFAAHRAHGNLWRAARVQCTLGAIIKRRGRLDEAATAYREAIATHRAAGDPLGLAVSLVNVGLLEKQRGDLATAAECYREAEEVAVASGSRRIEVEAIAVRATLAMHVGDLVLSRELLERQLALAEHAGSATARNRAIFNLGWIDFYANDFTAAKRHFEEILPTYRHLSQLGLRNLLSVLLETHAQLGDRAAFARIDIELREVESQADARIVANTCIARSLGRRLLDPDFDATDVAALTESLEAVRATVAGDDEIRALEVALELGRLALCLGDPEPARAAIRRAFEVAATLGMGPEAQLPLGARALERACDALARGEVLVRGCALAELTPGLRALHGV